MRETLPTELLVRLMSASPEQFAEVEHILGIKTESGKQRSEIGAAAQFVFERFGRMWRVVYDGTEFSLEDTLDARYLDFISCLAKVFPDKGQRILIYCNNNFRNEARAFASKSRSRR